MTQAVAIPAPQPVSIPIREILPYAVLVTVLALAALYFVSTDNNAMTLMAEGYVHEFLHDGRHLMAFPCH
ncbi:Probable cobalt transporter subunit (CbtB) [Haloechinothrix alba]|uniref:Probable cobalt transporter subunit (CbtB) n=1 Tax=Haloechinothrix alba TaxID=664784 RepID=A0A238WQC9_9PSEU|nr:CbtB-domain containing protein [Haloechinothrix alba]SNR48810.1 Probable cobalt transporter subunit (CbtB) [Haloechinothrix alba]